MVIYKKATVLIRTPHTDVWPHLNELHLQWPTFQKKPQDEELEILSSICGFGGDSIQLLTSRNIKVFKWISQAIQGISRCLLSEYSISMQIGYGIKQLEEKDRPWLLMPCGYFSWWVLISQDWLDLPINTVMFSWVLVFLMKVHMWVRVFLKSYWTLGSTNPLPQLPNLSGFRLTSIYVTLTSLQVDCGLAAVCWVWQCWVPGLFPMSFLFVLKLKKEQQPPRVSPDIIGFCVTV